MGEKMEMLKKVIKRKTKLYRPTHYPSTPHFHSPEAIPATNF